MLGSHRTDFELTIRQQPDRARMTGNKEKERKPIDPPPIVQLKIRQGNYYLAQNYLQNPHYFMCVSLYDAAEGHPSPIRPSTALAGTLVSSLHRLKDVDNTDGGFFIFGNLFIKLEGEFRIRFTLFEMRNDIVVSLESVISDRFTVCSPKYFPGMAESTFLSRLFADQGVKLRIRKGSRKIMKRSLQPEDYSQTTQPLSPSQPALQIPGAFSSYYPVDREYAPYYDRPPKIQRTSVDLSRGLHSNEGYFARDMSAYPETVNLCTSQVDNYRNQAMQEYPPGRNSISDYAIPHGHSSPAEVSRSVDASSVDNQVNDRAYSFSWRSMR
ncbi:hypothetical protein Plec18167_008123 [Paecilomyces lecythidis]|uniref:Velvet domain-containing protein n=1 Tax=Paecilomyces lecythidis TaxID=3004212 RepID=A0ABR3WYP8_9EURO